MQPKWIKVLVLSALIMVLLIVAGVTSKIGRSGNQPEVTPTAQPLDPAQPTAAAATDTAPTSAPQDGITVENGYYYINGELQKDTVIGDEVQGYFYVNAEGMRDNGYCNGLTIDGDDWNVIEGIATKVENEWDECLHSALVDIGNCTDSSMSRDEKLRAGFDYIKSDTHYLEGVLHDPPYNELDWPVVCSNDLFKEGMGDCFSYGAAFAFYGKACGFDRCYACNSGGHGWSEIDGKAYDPEWDMHHQEYNHFGVAPEDDCDVAYFTTLTDGVDWMYVNVGDKLSK